MSSNLDRNTLKRMNRRLLTSLRLSAKAHGQDSLVLVSRSCCGINSQNFRDSFQSFWARADSFCDSALVSSIKPCGSLTRTWTVRGTVHTFPTQDYYKHVFGSPVSRVLHSYDRYARQLGVPNREKRIELLYQPLLDEIKGEYVTKRFIGDFISERLTQMGIKGKMKLRRGWTSEATYSHTWEGVEEMSYMGLLVNAGRKGSENLWMSTRHWLGSRFSDPDPADCAAGLIRSYIEQYGPVTLNDIAYWSGHRKGDVAKILDSIRGDLKEERYKDFKDVYYAIHDSMDDAYDPPHALILPGFDSLIMGHSDKSRILHHTKRELVFTSAGVINPTILIRGFVAGTWKKNTQGSKNSVTVRPFKYFTVRDRKAVLEKFQEYGEYLGKEVKVDFAAA